MKKYILSIAILVFTSVNTFSQEESNCTNNVSTNPLVHDCIVFEGSPIISSIIEPKTNEK